MLAVAAVFFAYRLFGFPAVVRVAEGLTGFLIGFAFSGVVGQLFNLSVWILILAPALAVLFALFRPLSRSIPFLSAGPLKPYERRRRKW